MNNSECIQTFLLHSGLETVLLLRIYDKNNVKTEEKYEIHKCAHNLTMYRGQEDMVFGPAGDNFFMHNDPKSLRAVVQSKSQH